MCFKQVLVIAIVLAAMVPAKAQMFSGLSGDTAMTSLMSSNMRQQSLLNLTKKNRQAAANGTPNHYASNSAGPTKYAVTPSVAATARNDFLSRLTKNNPAVVPEVRMEMQRQDFGEIYARIVAPFGLHRGDAADALTAYTLLGWMIANGRTDPTLPQVAAARREVAVNMLANPAFAAETARAKLGEEVAILFVLLHSGWQSAQREGTVQQYSDKVTTMFKTQFGHDLRELALTDQGFEMRE